MTFFRVLGTLLSAAISLSVPAAAQGTIQRFDIQSDAFDGNLIGVEPRRSVEVYLPEGYGRSQHRYPVLFAFHDFFEGADALFERHDMDGLLDRAIAEGRLPPTIVVTADFSTPVASSLFTNSPVSGRWEDFIVEDLVPHIDDRFRTLADRETRGVFGYHIGGYGAIRMAARHPDLFGSVYALHPVATGVGNVNRVVPNWDNLLAATSLDDLKGDWASEIFASIYQAHVPNPNNPPLYFDWVIDPEDRSIRTDVYTRYTENFLLDSEVAQYADALKSLIAFKFDWGRHDPNQDHVVGNQHYTRKLRAFGVPHEAEEYNGGWWDGIFEPGGRVDNDLFPFFAEVFIAAN